MLQRVLSQLIGARDQFLRWNYKLRGHVVVHRAVVTNLGRDQVFGDEVDRRVLIPRRGNRLIDRERFVARLDEANLARAVVGEVDGAGRGADLLVVDIDERSLRIAVHVQPAAHDGLGRGRDQRTCHNRQQPGGGLLSQAAGHRYWADKAHIKTSKHGKLAAKYREAARREPVRLVVVVGAVLGRSNRLALPVSGLAGGG